MRDIIKKTYSKLEKWTKEVEKRIGIRKVIFLLALISSGVINRMKPGYVTSMLFYMLIFIFVGECLIVVYTYVYILIGSSVDKRSVIKGNSIHYQLNFENNSFFMFAPIDIHYYGSELLFRDNEKQRTKNIYLFSKDKKKIKKVIACKYRGVYSIGVDEININGFFGIFNLRLNNIETHKIVVYPTIYDLVKTKFKQASSENSNSIVAFDRFDKSVFSDVREYEEGDALNRIHWKLSASKGQLITKDYEGNISNKVKVILNNEVLDIAKEKNIIVEDYLVEGCVSICKYFLDSNNQIELFWDNVEGETLKGNRKKDFQRFYKELAALPFMHSEGGIRKTIDQATKTHEHSLIIVITATVDNRLAQLLIDIKKRGFEVITIILDDEIKELTEDIEKINRNPLYVLDVSGIEVKKFTFDENICRLDVVQ